MATHQLDLVVLSSLVNAYVSLNDINQNNAMNKTVECINKIHSTTHSAQGDEPILLLQFLVFRIYKTQPTQFIRFI